MNVLRGERAVKILLWLIALHSLIVGILLIILPPDFMVRFGYKLVNERFFQIQAGIFHLVMVAAYSLAARDPLRRRIMVRYTIIVKFMATLFLFGYSALIGFLPAIFLSGAGDFAMGLAVLYEDRWLQKESLYEH